MELIQKEKEFLERIISKYNIKVKKDEHFSRQEKITMLANNDYESYNKYRNKEFFNEISNKKEGKEARRK